MGTSTPKRRQGPVPEIEAPPAAQAPVPGGPPPPPPARRSHPDTGPGARAPPPQPASAAKPPGNPITHSHTDFDESLGLRLPESGTPTITPPPLKTFLAKGAARKFWWDLAGVPGTVVRDRGQYIKGQPDPRDDRCAIWSRRQYSYRP